MTDEIKELHIWPEKGENWLFNDQYLIPLYQRPYAWKFEKEISTLLDDIKGIGSNHCEHYRLGVLCVIAKGEQGKKEYEVVDGQQRLTTLYLLLKALFESDLNLSKEDKEVFEGAKENLIFENREISTDTLKNPIKDDSAKDVDSGIRAGFEGILKWIEERKEEERKSFIECLKKGYVYRVLLPKKTDPCKYFVRMNARGKQLEPVDVIKARLMIPLKGKEEDLEFFKYIWDACSRMDRYIQKTIDKESCDEIFKEWKDKDWKDGFLWTVEQKKKLEKVPKRDVNSSNDDANRKSIINFPTFLMHVLKLCELNKNKNKEVVAATDDKRLIRYFEDNWSCAFEHVFKDRTGPEVREFLYTLFYARYLFDGCIVRAEQEGETGWAIQHLEEKEEKGKKSLELVDSFELPDEEGLEEYEKTSKKIKMLQSCLRVTYTSPASMPWITELLKKLWDLSYVVFRSKSPNYYGVEVLDFLEGYSSKRVAEELKGKYEDVNMGTATPRILFNFLDYLLWRDRKRWVDCLPEDDTVKKTVNKGVYNFKFSYLSSVEHWYPQNPAQNPENGNSWEKDQFGNLFLIGGGENSSLSNDSFVEKKAKIGEWVKNGSNISLKGLHMYAKTLDEKDWKDTGCENLGKEHYHERLMNEIKAWNLGRDPSKLS